MPTQKCVSAPSRNQSMECFKIIASILVVFLHCPFPGTVGSVISVLGSIAVPMFFAITGYFNYGADRSDVIRRLKHLLRLYLVAAVSSVVWGALSTELQGGSTIAFLRSYCPDLTEIMRLLLLHQDPRNAQLWYLISVAACYLFLLLYLDFRGGKTGDYRPLYIIGGFQFSVFLSLGCLSGPLGMGVPYLLWFNGYYYGICFFTLGMFLHQYQQRILENFHLTPRKLTALVLLMILLNQLQAVTIGVGQIPIGGIVEVVALMLLLISRPTVAARPGFLLACVRKFGPWSSYIYVLHVIVIGFYQQHLCNPLLAALPGSDRLEPYLTPLLVAGLSLLMAIAYERGEWLLRRLRRRK